MNERPADLQLLNCLMNVRRARSTIFLSLPSSLYQLSYFDFAGLFCFLSRKSGTLSSTRFPPTLVPSIWISMGGKGLDARSHVGVLPSWYWERFRTWLAPASACAPVNFQGAGISFYESWFPCAVSFAHRSYRAWDSQPFTHSSPSSNSQDWVCITPLQSSRISCEFSALTLPKLVSCGLRGLGLLSYFLEEVVRSKREFLHHQRIWETPGHRFSPRDLPSLDWRMLDPLQSSFVTSTRDPTCP